MCELLGYRLLRGYLGEYDLIKFVAGGSECEKGGNIQVSADMKPLFPREF